MDETIARYIAHRSHAGQLTRSGVPMSEHVERVAAAVPDAARAVALLHDVLEKTGTGREELRRRGLTPSELAALDLLTRRDGESFAHHAVRIANADGAAGVMARAVKLADIDDHLDRRNGAVSEHQYLWARRLTAAAQLRHEKTPIRARRPHAA